MLHVIINIVNNNTQNVGLQNNNIVYVGEIIALGHTGLRF